ncbi:GAF and ANTAR domain-containing protein [Rathayibacter sp. CAU 1779]
MNDDGPLPADRSGQEHSDDPGDRVYPDAPVSEGDALCTPFLALPIDGASISVVGAGSPQATIGASDALAARLDELQFDLAEGPRWQAVREGRPVFAADLAAPAGDAWPIFASSALQHGVRAVFAFPLRLGAVIVGAVDLYRAAPGPLDRESAETAEYLAMSATASAAMLALRSARDETGVDRTGTAAMRREVHQAVGMIIVQLDVSATDAFARLRAHAFATGRTVQAVAFDVVDRRLDFGSLPGDRTDA